MKSKISICRRRIKLLKQLIPHAKPHEIADIKEKLKSREKELRQLYRQELGYSSK
jgi:hypothetical protein